MKCFRNEEHKKLKDCQEELKGGAGFGVITLLQYNSEEIVKEHIWECLLFLFLTL